MDYTAIIVAIIGSGLLTTILNRIFAVRDKRKAEKTGEAKALRLIMKNNIRVLCNEYLVKGYIYADELADLESMHRCYHDDLGGNGWLDSMMSSVRRLPVRGIESH